MATKAVKAANTKGIKKGSAVWFRTRNGGPFMGEVVGIVQPYDLPDLRAKGVRDLKMLGFNKMMQTGGRDHKSFLVSCGGFLYWPKVSTIQVV
ncbi:MAG: hypothetical protein CVV44_04125 [Spirochaetae bacterium HGW-Spirochaetae-1]|jgi:hypothetical protein|nr:MAG: hypothetical protein CVV44_04125 [Spirochaetae bacterium HGW-Spirochaetae-1]